MNSPHNPVIIIGMHRSGTSMLTRLLETLGLFVGEDKDANHESIFFGDINLWIMSQSGGSWDNPGPVHYLIQNKEIRGLVSDYIFRYLLTTPRAIPFLGWKKYFHSRRISDLIVPWGWKHPLNTFILPLWRDLFPDAKIIHIYRHGVDVANSLKERGRQEMTQARKLPAGVPPTVRQLMPLAGSIRKLYYELPFLHTMWPKNGGFIDSVRCDSLEGGLSLWEEYLSEAGGHVRALKGRALELKYETLLREPYETLKQAAFFCDLPVKDEAIERARKRVQAGRAYAYRKNSALLTFAERVGPRLSAHGY